MGNFTIGIIFIIIGVICLIAIDRRQFYRRIEREKMGGGGGLMTVIQKLQAKALLRAQ
mgnify:CR=1 FL=1